MLVPHAASGALPAVYSTADEASLLMAHQQVQAQQLLAAQEQLSNSFAAQSQQQQQHHHQLLLNGATTSLPMQLSVQPQLTTIAVHMAAAQMLPQQQQQQQQLGTSAVPMMFVPAGTDCNSMPAVSMAAADSAAAALVNAPATSAGLVLGQTAAAAVPHSQTMAAGNAAAAAAVSAPGSFMGDMFQGFDGYTSAAVAAAAAAAADRIASPLPKQQLQQVLLAGSRAACGSLADCNSNSSSCSPMVGLPTALLETSGIGAALGNASMGQLVGSHNGVNVMTSVGMSFCGTQLAASPTFSNSSSGSRSFCAAERVMY
jgi:hypothetical protein